MMAWPPPFLLVLQYSTLVRILRDRLICAIFGKFLAFFVAKYSLNMKENQQQLLFTVTKGSFALLSQGFPINQSFSQTKALSKNLQKDLQCLDSCVKFAPRAQVSIWSSFPTLGLN